MLNKFFPKQSSIPAIKCNHRWGCGATFSEETDSIQKTSCYAVEMYAFRHNFRIGAFIWDRLNTYVDGIPESEKTGVIRYDIYIPDDYWMSPTGVITLIPDYNYDTWTAYGAANFSGAVEGQPKPTRYPNHGPQLYEISGGVYGYDNANSVSGSNNLQEFNGMVDYIKNWLKAKIHREPSAGSWRQGQYDGYIQSIPKFLSARNSFHDGYPTNNVNSWYGPELGLGDSWISGEMTRPQTNNYSSSSRFWDRWQAGFGTLPDVLTWMGGLVSSIYNIGGYFRDFTHWHAMRRNNTLYAMDEMMSTVRAAMSGMDWHTCSNGEAWEYLYVRELCQRVNATEFVPGRVNIVIDVVDRFKGTFSDGIANDVGLSMMNTPLCVQVDLSNSTLAGKNVKASSGKMRNKGNDVYIVEVPFTKEEGFSNVIIEEGEDGYYIETRPIITKSISGSIMTVTTDIPTRCALFSVASGGNDFDSLIDQRDNELNTTHKFNITAGLDYRIGAISEYGQTNLLEP